MVANPADYKSVLDYDRFLADSAKRIIEIDQVAGAVTVDDGGKISFDQLNQGWMPYLTPETINIGDVIADRYPDGSVRTWRIHNKCKTEVRLDAGDGRPMCHPSWEVFARGAHRIIERATTLPTVEGDED
jgi:hypothetical protein